MITFERLSTEHVDHRCFVCGQWSKTATYIVEGHFKVLCDDCAAEIQGRMVAEELAWGDEDA